MRRAAFAATGAAVAAVLVLNVAGVLRYPGGPLREGNADGMLWLDIRPSDQGSSATSNTPEADWAQADSDLVFRSLWLSNPWPWPARIERITPIEISGDLVTSEVLVHRSGASPDTSLWSFGPVTPDQRAVLDTGYVALPASIEPGDTGRDVALVVRGGQPGPAGFEAIAIDYQVGPFSFRVVHHVALHECLGSTPEERTCPGDD